jgi:hypothetical protein
MKTTKLDCTGAGVVWTMKEHNVSQAVLITKYACHCTETHTRSINYFDMRSTFSYMCHVVQYNNGYIEIHVFEESDFKCEVCAPPVQYCDELSKPVGFDHRHFFHGTMAYNHCTLEESIQRAIDVMDNPSWQICCSTRPLGPWGIMTKGNVLAVSNIDLCSQIDEHGRRYYDAGHWRAESMVYSPKDIDNTKWHHNEIVMNNHKLTSLWVSNEAPTEVAEAVLSLAKKLNLRCMFI